MTRYKAANLAYHLDHDGALIADLVDDETAVLALVECRDRDNEPVDVGALLGPDWDTRQDCSSGARAGSVIAVRRGYGVRVLWSRLVTASEKGRDVQVRYRRNAVLFDNGVVTRIAVQHNPLKATGRQDDAVRSAQRWVRRARRKAAAVARRKLPRAPRLRWVFFGDTNMGHREMRAHLRAPYSAGADVMTAVWSYGWGHVKTDSEHVRHTDHAALIFDTED